LLRRDDIIILFLDKKIKNLFIAGCKSCTAYGGKKSITRHFSAVMPPGHFPSGPIKRFYRFIRNKYKKDIQQPDKSEFNQYF